MKKTISICALLVLFQSALGWCPMIDYPKRTPIVSSNAGDDKVRVSGGGRSNYESFVTHSGQGMNPMYNRGKAQVKAPKKSSFSRNTVELMMAFWRMVWSR